MIYSQVLWALIIDRIFWNVKMNLWTFLGVGGVVSSLLLVSLAKEIPAFRGAHAQKQQQQQDHQAVPGYEDGGVTIHEIDLDDMIDEVEAENAVC